MGLGLYGTCIGVLSLMMGEFHVVTIITTWIAFSEINQHNHDLMDAPHFPFKYLNFMSSSHHVHHSRFTSGNFATIILLYDKLFGTYDAGDGYGHPAGAQEADIDEAEAQDADTQGGDTKE